MLALVSRKLSSGDTATVVEEAGVGRSWWWVGSCRLAAGNRTVAMEVAGETNNNCGSKCVWCGRVTVSLVGLQKWFVAVKWKPMCEDSKRRLWR